MVRWKGSKNKRYITKENRKKQKGNNENTQMKGKKVQGEKKI